MVFKVGLDYIFHEKDYSRLGADPFYDFLLSTVNGSFGLWLIENKDSLFLIRQLASAGYHVARLGYTVSFSCFDLAVSSIINKASLSRDRAIARAIRRMMYTLKRNGGVYQDLAELIKTFGNVARLSPACVLMTDALNEWESTDRPERDSEMIVKKIFEHELRMPFDKVFKSITLKPNESGQLISHSAVLRSGQQVAITVMKPNVARMRFLDLIPLRLIQGIVNLIPFIPGEKALVNRFVDRLNFSIRKEIAARQLILSHFGVNLDKEPEEVLWECQNYSTPIYVAPPLKRFCSKHVMVTGEIGKKVTQITKSHARTIASAFADFAFKHNFVIGDWSKSNLRMGQHGLTLMRFAHCAQCDPVKFSALLRLHVGTKSMKRRAGLTFGFKEDEVEEMIKDDRLYTPLTRQALGQNASTVLGYLEGSCAVLNAKIDSGSSSTVMAPIWAGTAAKLLSPNLSHANPPFNVISWLKYL